jgi:hypothetical protein
VRVCKLVRVCACVYALVFAVPKQTRSDVNYLSL